MKQKLVLGLSLAAICALSFAAPAQLGLSFDKRADSLPVLNLPYASYQATNYNPNGDVSLPFEAPRPPLTWPADIHLQEHPLCRPTGRRPSLGQTGASRDRDWNPRWLIRPHLRPSAHQRTACDGSWCQQPGWGGCESVLGRHSGTFFYQRK